MKENEIQSADVDPPVNSVVSWVIAIVLIVAAIVVVPMLVNMFL